MYRQKLGTSALFVGIIWMVATWCNMAGAQGFGGGSIGGMPVRPPSPAPSNIAPVSAKDAQQADAKNAAENAEGDQLLASIASGKADAVKALINAGTKPGTRSLNLAAARGNVEIVEILLAAGADVSAKDRAGKTALAVALENDHKEVADLILDFKSGKITVGELQARTGVSGQGIRDVTGKTAATKKAEPGTANAGTGEITRREFDDLAQRVATLEAKIAAMSTSPASSATSESPKTADAGKVFLHLEGAPPVCTRHFSVSTEWRARLSIKGTGDFWLACSTEPCDHVDVEYDGATLIESMWTHGQSFKELFHTEGTAERISPWMPAGTWYIGINRSSYVITSPPNMDLVFESK
jgi:hypothetical protein